jgi:hypothetical protein
VVTIHNPYVIHGLLVISVRERTTVVDAVVDAVVDENGWTCGWWDRMPETYNPNCSNHFHLFIGD